MTAISLGFHGDYILTRLAQGMSYKAGNKQ